MKTDRFIGIGIGVAILIALVTIASAHTTNSNRNYSNWMDRMMDPNGMMPMMNMMSNQDIPDGTMEDWHWKNMQEMHNTMLNAMKNHTNEITDMEEKQEIEEMIEHMESCPMMG